MSIISKETYEKFSPEEKEAVRERYISLVKSKDENDLLRELEMDEIFPEEALDLLPRTYDEIAKRLFYEKEYWVYDLLHGIVQDNRPINRDINATSRVQLEKILAFNKLLNVAKELNGDWIPNFTNEEKKWYIGWEVDKDNFYVDWASSNICLHQIYFKTKKLAERAVQILGVETLKKIYSPV